jgi:NhaA family Na+:H+ antiporter
MPRSKRSFHALRVWYEVRRRGSHFFGSQWAGGVMLLVFMVVALVLANLDATREFYHRMLETPVGFVLGGHELVMSFEMWVNDALMAVFFFVVGLEIKRELMVGRLSSFKQAVMPVAGAVGGMAVPALIYLLFTAGSDFQHGWAIPTATDIAFVVGVMALLGDRVPVSMKVFVTALAIADDLGAIIVIATAYSSHLDFALLGAGAAIFAVLFMMNRAGVTGVWVYLIPGIVAWYLFLHSGIHATIAGVILAMTMPTQPRYTRRYFIYKQRYNLEEFRHYDRAGVELISNERQTRALWQMRQVTHAAVSPAQRLELLLGPLVTFLIMPVFALVNAGVEIKTASELMVFDTPLGSGIFFGLLVGKPVGIFLMSFLLIKTRIGSMPEGVTWRSMLCTCCLAGIGFTMAIFVDNLAFAGSQWVDYGKIAVLSGSFCAALLGSLLLVLNARCDQSRLRRGKIPQNQMGTE